MRVGTAEQFVFVSVEKYDDFHHAYVRIWNIVGALANRLSTR